MLANPSVFILALPLLTQGVGAALAPAPFFFNPSESVGNSHGEKVRSSGVVTGVTYLSHADPVEEYRGSRERRVGETTYADKEEKYDAPKDGYSGYDEATSGDMDPSYEIHMPDTPASKTGKTDKKTTKTDDGKVPKTNEGNYGTQEGKGSKSINPKGTKDSKSSKEEETEKHEKITKDGKSTKVDKTGKSSKQDPGETATPPPYECECVGYDPCDCDEKPEGSYAPITEPIQFVMVRDEAGSTYPDSFGIADTLALNGKIFYWQDYDSQLMDTNPSGGFVGLCTGVSTSGDLLCTYEILLEKTPYGGMGAFVASGPNYEKESQLVVTGLAYDFARYSGGTLVTIVDSVHPYLYATLHLVE
jgi:hypothetical protein